MIDWISLSIAILAVIIAIVAIILIFVLRVQGPPGNAGVFTYQAISSPTMVPKQYGTFFEIIATSPASGTIMTLETDSLLTPGTSFIVLNNTPNSYNIIAGPSGAYGYPAGSVIASLTPRRQIQFWGLPSSKLGFSGNA